MTTYYVDFTLGNDAFDGSELTPFKYAPSMPGASGNSEALDGNLLPDDKILLKRGEVWTGQGITVGSSGASGSPITYDAYGSGAAPIIDCNGTVARGLVISSKDYITVANITVKNATERGVYYELSNNLIFDTVISTLNTNYGFYGSTGSNISHINCEANSNTNQSGFYFLGSATLSQYISYMNCDADSNGVDGLLILGQLESGPSIRIVSDVTIIGGAYNNNTEDGIDVLVKENIVIDGATCNGNIIGIDAWGQDSSPSGDGLPVNDNLVVQNCSVSNNSGRGIYVAAQKHSILYNVCTDNGTLLDFTSDIYSAGTIGPCYVIGNISTGFLGAGSITVNNGTWIGGGWYRSGHLCTKEYNG
jgi:hypothetical protein